MWFIHLLGMFASVAFVVLVVGVAGWGLQALWLKLGNPGGAVQHGARRHRGAGEGYYVEPQSDDGP